MAHFKKYAEKPGDGPDKQSNYKPAPGDKGAKTKLSKHTIKYRKMYGEDAVDVAKQKIASKNQKTDSHRNTDRQHKPTTKRQTTTTKQNTIIIIISEIMTHWNIHLKKVKHLRQ